MKRLSSNNSISILIIKYEINAYNIILICLIIVEIKSIIFEKICCILKLNVFRWCEFKKKCKLHL